MIKSIVQASICLVVLAVTVQAAPWEVAWEGDVYPETQGWIRSSSETGTYLNYAVHREIQDGVLFLDSRSDSYAKAYEQYDYYFTDSIQLESGEYFYVEWAVQTDADIHYPLGGETGYTDTGILFFLPGDRACWINLASDSVSDYGTDIWNEEGQSYSIEPGIMHEYLLVTYDLETFALYVDGYMAFQDSFGLWGTTPNLAFGDRGLGASSTSYWDYVRFGVVPEPATLMLVLGMVPLAHLRR